MLQFIKHTKHLLTLLLVSLISMACTAQTSYRSTDNFTAKILGTSTLHDWEMDSKQGKCSCLFTIDASNKITAVSELSFSIKVESFVSDHKLMNTKTYEALKSDKYPNINFVITSSTITQINATTAVIKSMGRLTIAGTTKETEIVAYCAVSPTDQSISCKVVKKLKMTDFNVKPPVVLMGTIKTGDDITIEFSFKMVK